MTEFTNIEIRHVHNEQNVVANIMTKLTRDQIIGLEVFEEPLLAILNALLDDEYGISHMREVGMHVE